MITILLILATWYATKVYYTNQFKIKLTVKDEGMGLIQCTKCSQTIYTRLENFRNPYYCTTCA